MEKDTTIQEWLADPEFTSLPKATQLGKIKSYFDSVYGDDEYNALAEGQKELYRSSFIKAQGLSPIHINKDRGFLGDIVSHASRGVVQAVKQVGGGMQMLDFSPEEEKWIVPSVGKSLTKWATEAEKKYDILKPDITEAMGKESALKRGIMGAIESTPASLSPLTVGAIGTLTGGPIVGGAAGIATLFGTFGLGEYQNTYDETKRMLREKGAPENEIHDRAHKHALTSAFAETGGELAGDLASLTFFGMFGKRAIKQSVKQTIRQLISAGGAKEFTKAAIKTIPFEVGSEMSTAYFQTKSARKTGITDMTVAEGVTEAILPATFMSLFFGASIRGMQAIQAHNLYDKLNGTDAEKRWGAASEVASRMEEESEKRAWLDTAKKYIKAGKEIPLSKPIVDFAIQKKESSKDELDDIEDTKILLLNSIRKSIEDGKDEEGNSFTIETIEDLKKSPNIQKLGVIDELNKIVVDHVAKTLEPVETAEEPVVEEITESLTENLKEYEGEPVEAPKEGKGVLPEFDFEKVKAHLGVNYSETPTETTVIEEPTKPIPSELEPLAEEVKPVDDGNYHIYETKVKMPDGSIKDMYGVPSRSRKSGRGFGDTLFNTLDEAKAEVEFNRKKDIEDIKHKTERVEKEIQEKEAKTKREYLDGFADDLPPMQKGRILASLNKQLRFDGKVMTIKDKVKEIIAEGGELRTEQENIIKPMSRTRWNRADNKQQAEHERKIRDAGKKTVYYVGNYDLGKTAYDYARFLKTKPTSTPELEPLAKEAEAPVTEITPTEEPTEPEKPIEDKIKPVKPEPKTIRIDTASYNDRRYGKPWIAKVDFSANKQGEYKWGDWIGRPGEEGILEINVMPGDIVAKGQKDRRQISEPPTFYVVTDEGELKRLLDKVTAYKRFLEQKEKPKAEVAPEKTEKPAIKTKTEEPAETKKAETTEEKHIFLKQPSLQIAGKVVKHIATGEFLTPQMLFAWADEAYGGTQAEGKYTSKDAYDAMELGINKAIENLKLNPATADFEQAKKDIAYLRDMINNLPTQSKRTEETDKFQQFSTPPQLAYAVNWVANIRKGETYLEPSAGIGGLAVFGKNAGAKVVVNELSPRRREILKNLDFDQVFGEDAEQINNILPKDINPTVIVMNPPFSATAGRLSSKTSQIGFDHVEQALKRLLTNGRLVVILGSGVTDTVAFKKWVNGLGDNYTLYADIGLSGREYAKYGTTYGNQILVIDKVPNTGKKPITGDVDTSEELITLLKGVRDERKIISEQIATQPESKGISETSRGSSIPIEPILPTTGDVGGRERTSDRSQGGRLSASDANVAASKDDGLGREGEQERPLGEIRPPEWMQDTEGLSMVSARPGEGRAGSETGIEPVEGRIEVEKKKSEKAKEALSDSIYESYKPQKVDIKGAKEHPGKLVESAAMATVEPPDPSYSPNLPVSLIQKGKLSAAQLETVVYAGQAHSEMLPTGERKGYFVGDGCVAGETKIYDPDTGIHTEIEQLAKVGEPITVLSLTKDGFVKTTATAPFLKGEDDLYQIILQSGRKVIVTDNHKFLTPFGWMRIVDGLAVGHSLASVEVPLVSNLGCCPLVHGEDVRDWFEKPEDCLDHYFDDSHLYDGQLLWGLNNDQETSPSQDGVLGYNLGYQQKDELEISQGYIHQHQKSCHLSKNNFSQVENHDLSLTLIQDDAGCVLSSKEIRQDGQQFHAEIKNLHQQDILTRQYQQGHEDDLSLPGNEPEPLVSLENTRQLVASLHTELPIQCMECPTDNQSKFDTHLRQELISAFSSFNYYSRWDRIMSIEFIRRDKFYDMYVPETENYVAEGIVHHNTGVGKGREIAGVLLDNWRQGRKKAIWISQNSPLIEDAKRDVRGIGWDDGLIFDFGKTKRTSSITSKEGIAFLGYDTLKSKDKKNKEISRLKQLVNWVGKDFDGVIVFDEAHNMGNALAIKRARGTSKPSEKALAGVELQRLLPKARVLYVSATGATEVMNLAYADRLGLWGEGTPFANKTDFVTQISSGGIAAMELVARDMKAMGAYTARSLSYDDVKYERLDHTLTPQQREVYNEFARVWQIVLANVNEALALTKGNKSGDAKKNAMSVFWSSVQRFFNQVITSMQMPSVINSIEKDIKDGHSSILQIVNTNEAGQSRALARLEEEDELEDLDLTPREQLMEYVKNSFPVAQYQAVEDIDGKVTYKPILDSAGNPVENAEAVALREKLLNELGSIRGVDGPLEILLNHFGVNKVAEITGRTRRVVYEQDEKNNKRKIVERRSKAKTMADADAFMNDKKPILIFSYAGGTGRSYHADLEAKNQRLRRHYLLQAGWIADRATQAFGRSHRSHQKQAPEYILVTTDIIGQKRFISSIARRLDQLGALTKGQRETGSGGFFTARDNLESVYAQDALNRLIHDIYYHQVPDMDISTFMQQTGLTRLIDVKTGALNISSFPPVNQFLNRLLAMNLDKQVEVFTAFSDRMDENIKKAMEEGELDVGLETLKAKNIEKASEQIVHTDKSGAQTKFVELDVTQEARKLPFENLKDSQKTEGFYQNVKSGRIYAAGSRNTRTDANTGKLIDYHRMYSSKANVHNVTISDLNDPKKYNKLTDTQAKKLWDVEYDALPDTVTYREHLITGTILPIWDRLTGKARIMRIQTSDGERMIGRIIPQGELTTTLNRIGATASKSEMTAKDIFHKVKDFGFQIELANGWKILRRKVSGENRIELKGPDYRHNDELAKHGVFTERIQWETRYFIPTTNDGITAIEAITANRPVINSIAPLKIKEDVPETKLSIADTPLTPQNIQDFGKIVSDIRNYLAEILPQEVIDRIDTKISPLISLTGKDIEKSLAEHGIKTITPEQILGATIINELQAIMEFVPQYDSKGLADTAYHEGLHVAFKWLLPEKDYKRLLKLYGNEENAVKAGAAYFLKKKVEGVKPIPIYARRLFIKLRKIFDMLRNFLKGKGFATAEDIWEKIGAKKYSETAKPAEPAAKGETQLSVKKDIMKELQQAIRESQIALGQIQDINAQIPVNKKLLEEETRWETLRRVMEDKNIRYKKLMGNLKEMGIEVPEELDIYDQLDLLPRKTARVALNIYEQKEKFVKDAVEQGVSLADVDLLVRAQHAEERNIAMQEKRAERTGMLDLEDGLSGMTTKEANRVLKKFEGNTKVHEFADRIRQVAKDTLSFLYHAGLITRKEYKNLDSLYQMYVPLQRHMDEEDSFSGITTGKGIDVRGKEYKRAVGSHREVISPVSSVFQNSVNAMRRAANAEIGRAIIKLVQQNPQLSKLFTITKRPVAPVVKQAGSTIFRPRYHFAHDEIGTKINGVQYVIKIKDPLLAKAAKNHNISSLPMLIKGLKTIGLPIRIMQRLVTQYRPDFLVRNFMRDLGEALINLGVERAYLKEHGKGLRREITKNLFKSQKEVYKELKSKSGSQMVKEFFEDGGDVGHFWGETYEKAEQSLYALEKRFQNEGFEKVKNAARAVNEFITDVQSAVELGIRFSTYKALRSRGFSRMQAVKASSDLTINFARQGEWTAIFKAFYMFFNPAVQGTSKLFRTITNPYGRKIVGTTLAGLTAAGFVTGMFASLIGGDDDDKISEFAKNTSVTLAVGGKQLTFWILPYGYNTFFSLGVNLAQLVNGKTSLFEATKSLLGVAFDSFSPIGGAGKVKATTFAPAQIKPLLEISTNTAWHGGKIHPEQRYDITPTYMYRQYFQSAPKYSILMAEYVNKLTGIDASPNDYDYAFRQYFGGAYEMAYGIPSSMFKMASEGEVEYSKIPIAKQFIRELKPESFVYKTIHDILDVAGKRKLTEFEKKQFEKALIMGTKEGVIDEEAADRNRQRVESAQNEVAEFETTGSDKFERKREERERRRKRLKELRKERERESTGLLGYGR